VGINANLSSEARPRAAPEDGCESLELAHLGAVGLNRVPFGRGWLRFRLPAGMRATVAEARFSPPLSDPVAAVRSALQTPLESPPLAQLARETAHRGGRVCLVFTDATRACPDQILVPPILDVLTSAGIKLERITLLCATGLHRPSTSAEKEAKLRPDVVARYRVVDHNATDERNLVSLGTYATDDGHSGRVEVPLVVNRMVAEADLLIATGVVEPHQYAGYSGGGKTVTIGTGGEATIAATHTATFLDHPGVRLGRVNGNPFQKVVREGARRAGLDFVVNVLADGEGRVLAVSAGAPDAVHDALVHQARGVFELPVAHQFDVAVAGVGYPKDANLYQASRAASYLQFAPVPVVRPGGLIILPAPIPEGAGAGLGEQRFLAALASADDLSRFLDGCRRSGFPPGVQRAFVMATVLLQNNIIVVGATRPDVVQQTKMIPVTTMADAFTLAAERLGPELDVLIVPHALLTLPVVESF